MKNVIYAPFHKIHNGPHKSNVYRVNIAQDKSLRFMLINYATTMSTFVTVSCQMLDLALIFLPQQTSQLKYLSSNNGCRIF